MMQNTYLIDSENVGDCWIDLLKKDTESKYLVFYTGHSPRIDYDHVRLLMDAETKPEFIRCSEGSNSLDFQLVTYLGYLLRTDEEKEMTIVSNDAGFDSVVTFWNIRGRSVKRIPSHFIQNRNPKEKQNCIEPVSPDEVAAPRDVSLAENTQTKNYKELIGYLRNGLEQVNKPVQNDDKTQSEEDVFLEEIDNDYRFIGTCEPIVSSVPRSVYLAGARQLYGIEKSELEAIVTCLDGNPSYIHLAYIKFYKNGDIIYRHMKAEGFSLRQCSVPSNRKGKIEIFGKLIFKYCNVYKVEIPESIYEFLETQVTSDEKKNSVKKKLVESYGETIETEAIHQILKPFYNVIAKIK